LRWTRQIGRFFEQSRVTTYGCGKVVTPAAVTINIEVAVAPPSIWGYMNFLNAAVAFLLFCGTAHAQNIPAIAPNITMGELVDLAVALTADLERRTITAPAIAGSPALAPLPAQFDLLRRPYGPLVTAAAEVYGVDAHLIDSVIWKESAYRSSATSHKGAQGLMQLMPGTAKRFAVKNSYDPVQNVAGGTAYLRYLLDLFGDESLALAAYNAGEGRVLKHGGIPPFL
jgi:soluble lytic murein transglycosylase-like protein